MCPPGETQPCCEKMFGEFVQSASSPNIFANLCFRLPGGASPSPTVLSSCFLYDLEEVEFQIIRLRHVPEDGVIRPLLAHLDLPVRSICWKRSLGMKWLQEAVARYPPRGRSFMAR